MCCIWSIWNTIFRVIQKSNLLYIIQCSTMSYAVLYEMLSNPEQSHCLGLGTTEAVFLYDYSGWLVLFLSQEFLLNLLAFVWTLLSWICWTLDMNLTWTYKYWSMRMSILVLLEMLLSTFSIICHQIIQEECTNILTTEKPCYWNWLHNMCIEVIKYF